MPVCVEYPKYCAACQGVFEKFNFTRLPVLNGATQIIRVCPLCGAEIEAEFVQKK